MAGTIWFLSYRTVKLREQLEEGQERLRRLRRNAVAERARAASNNGGRRCDLCNERAIGHSHSGNTGIMYLCHRHRLGSRLEAARKGEDWDFEFNDGRPDQVDRRQGKKNESKTHNNRCASAVQA